MNSAEVRQNRKVGFICGAPHSGSTLLGMVLGSHADGFYLGESKNIQFLGNPNIIERKRVCKLCGPDCRIWKDFQLDETRDVYEQLSRKTGKPVIIDSVKNPAWLAQQIRTLEHTAAAERFLIFLQRDGRAVINSRIRKDPAQDVKKIITDWSSQIEATSRLFQQFDGAKISIHYEAFASQPAVITQQLCEFLGVAYQPEMLQYYRHEHHPLGGNAGTQYLVSQSLPNQDKQITPYLEAHHAYYLTQPADIRLDLRWKQELQPAVEQLFEKMAGHLNAEFRWEAKPNV